MYNLLLRLYDALGLELESDGENPMLLIDDELRVYFDESPQGLEMCCPLGKLPVEVAVLQKLLQLNYCSNPVVLGADADGELLLALLRMPEDSSGVELQEGLGRLLAATKELRKTLD